jgi:hypothetical protein
MRHCLSGIVFVYLFDAMGMRYAKLRLTNRLGVQEHVRAA